MQCVGSLFINENSGEEGIKPFVANLILHWLGELLYSTIRSELLDYHWVIILLHCKVFRDPDVNESVFQLLSIS